MPIQQTTPNSQIDAYIQQQVERMQRAIIRSLQYVGEQCIAEARSSANFTDRTGNLRSSIGYALIRDGKVVSKSEPNVVKNGEKGASEGKKFIAEVVSEFPQGIVLVVTAGMRYAKYVTAKGYNVLDSAELLADKLVPQLLSQLGFKR